MQYTTVYNAHGEFKIKICVNVKTLNMYSQFFYSYNAASSKNVVDSFKCILLGQVRK